MSQYNEFPPVANLLSVLQNCPQAALLYIKLWKHIKKSTRVAVKKVEIKKRFLISPTLFRNYLLALNRVDILTFEESHEYFLIDFSRSSNG